MVNRMALYRSCWRVRVMLTVIKCSTIFLLVIPCANSDTKKNPAEPDVKNWNANIEMIVNIFGETDSANMTNDMGNLKKRSVVDSIGRVVDHNIDRLKGVIVLFSRDENTTMSRQSLNLSDSDEIPENSGEDGEEHNRTGKPAPDCGDRDCHGPDCNDPDCDHDFNCRDCPLGEPCICHRLWSHERREGKAYIDQYTRLLESLYQLPSVHQKISPFDYDKDKDKKIQLGFNPFKVLSVNEKEQAVSIASLVVVKWNDDSLRWRPAEFDNITKIEVKSDRIWIPSIIVPKANGDGFELRKPAYVTVDVKDTTTNIRLSTLFKFTASCPLDLSRFPFDTQQCPILFEEENKRPLIPFAMKNQKDGESGQWDVVDKSTFEERDDNCVVFTITMKRRGTFYIANFLIPLHMTSFVSLFVFWIPPETGEKISFMVSIYVSTAMYNSFIDKILPHSLTTLPAYNIVAVCVNVQIALTFIASLLVLRQYRHQQTDADNRSAMTNKPPPPSANPAPSATRHAKNLHNLSALSKTSPTQQELIKDQMTSADELYTSSTSSFSYYNAVTQHQHKSAFKKNNIVGVMEAVNDDYQAPHCISCPQHYDDTQRPQVPRGSGFLDYRIMDKVFFGAFAIGFVLILVVPWGAVMLV